MTLNDFLKRIDKERDKDKIILFREGKGWSNIDVEVKDSEISIFSSTNSPFKSDN